MKTWISFLNHETPECDQVWPLLKLKITGISKQGAMTNNVSVPVHFLVILGMQMKETELGNCIGGHERKSFLRYLRLKPWKASKVELPLLNNSPWIILGKIQEVTAGEHKCNVFPTPHPCKQMDYHISHRKLSNNPNIQFITTAQQLYHSHKWRSSDHHNFCASTTDCLIERGSWSKPLAILEWATGMTNNYCFLNLSISMFRSTNRHSYSAPKNVKTLLIIFKLLLDNWNMSEN